jgi:hypothetical protein
VVDSFHWLAEEWGKLGHVFDRAQALLWEAQSLAALGRLGETACG